MEVTVLKPTSERAGAELIIKNEAISPVYSWITLRYIHPNARTVLMEAVYATNPNFGPQ